VRRARHRGGVAAVAALLAAAGLGACDGCSRPPSVPPERRVPADALGAVVVPDLRAAARALGGFLKSAKDFPGTGDLPELRTTLRDRLGFDPGDAGAIRDAGIDLRGGAALWVPRGGGSDDGDLPRPVLLLPVSRRSAAEATVERLRRGAAPDLAVGWADGYVLLGTGPGAAEAVARAAALPEGEALAGADAWRTARAAAGEDAVALAFAGPASRLVEGKPALRDGLALALAAQPGLLRLRLLVLLGDRLPPVPVYVTGGDPGALAARLDPAAVAVARWSGDPALLGALVPLLPAAARARLGRAGVDARADLLGALAPGATLSLSLAPHPDLARLDAAALADDPLRLVRLEALVPLRDAGRFAEASRRVAGRERPAGFALAAPGGEVAWRVGGTAGGEPRLVLAAGPPGGLAALEARLAAGSGGYRAPTDAARRAIAGGGFGALVLDAGNLVAAVRALPPESFGAGPGGFVLRSLAERALEQASRLAAVTLRVEPATGALAVAAEIEPLPGRASP
jgi:hypothetical protein